MKNTYMRIKELEQRSGVPRSTIHYYLREGLLHAPTRTGRTMAYYDETHLNTLAEIKKLKKDMRLPVTFIKKQLQERGQSSNGVGTTEAKIAANAEGMGDPRLKRKRQIIQVGMKIFSEKGFHRTRVQDITSELGISTGTFYLYFSDKRDLFVEVVDDMIQSILGDAAKVIKKEKDFKKRLLLRGKAFFENYSKYAEILSQLRAEMTGEGDWPRERVKDIYHQLTLPIIREAQEAINQGYLRQFDPDLFAYAVTGLIEVMSFRTTMDENYTYDDIIAFLIDLVEGGINLSPPSPS